jgi:large subunit ribosomal protein L4
MPNNNFATQTGSLGLVRAFGGAFQPLRPITLPPELFCVPRRVDLIHRVVCWFRAGERAGLASTKGRGEVAGSNRKIHAQKGTGRARAGDARAPHRRGGNLRFLVTIALNFLACQI